MFYALVRLVVVDIGDCKKKRKFDLTLYFTKPCYVFVLLVVMKLL
jgi:hypothetical protein